jgi:acetyltransferase-like isoleucine patch superfamily enzyme
LLELILTREDANSESALLVEWLEPDRAQVKKGQPVCVVETSKSAIELESPGDGILCQLAPAGDEVDMGNRIAVIAAGEAEVAALEAELAQAAASAPAPAAGGPERATRKAIELAAEHGIDLAAIERAGFITAEDVLALVGSGASWDEAAAAGPLAGLDLTGVTLPAALDLDGRDGLLDAEFYAELVADPDAVRALAPPERLALYRRHGARIGEEVGLGEGSVIVAPRIVLGDGVSFGGGCSVRCEDAFLVGPLTRFGARLTLECRRAVIGAGGFLCDDVTFAGGGTSDAEALLVIGDIAFVGDQAFVNPCRPVVIGREVFLTMRSVLITHNVGHSLLEGFENRFAPIVLEDRSQIGIGAVVYAGCRIGREAIVASNSYVVANIPPGKLAIGVPARAAGDAKRAPSRARQSELAEQIVADLAVLLGARNHPVAQVELGGLRGFAVGHDGHTSHVLYAERLDDGFETPPGGGETVILTLELSGPAPDGCSVVDLLARHVHGTGGPVLDATRELCRKRGVRFTPEPWRYSSGLL